MQLARFRRIQLSTIGEQAVAVLSRPYAASVSAAVAAMSLAALGATLVLKLWNATLGVPFVYQGDGLLGQMIVKGVLDHGWYLTNSNLGAPYGQELYDYPVANGNTLAVLLVKAIGLATHDYATVVNVFFLLTFPLIALTAFLALRGLGLARAVSIVFAVLYALLPYHFLRGETELFLSAYFAVPLGCYLVLSLLLGRPLLASRPGVSGWRRFGSGKNALTLTACVVIGAASLYYALFTLALLAVACLVLLLASRSLRAVLPGLAVMAVIVVTLLLQFAPTLAYRSAHGTDKAVGTRTASESELYGLKLADLLLPTEGHRIGPLARLRDRYTTTTPIPGEGTQAVGIVGAAGLVLAVLAVVLLPFRRDRARAEDPRLPAAGVAAIAAILLGTVGGVSSLFAYVVTPQVHAWNRLAIFIAFFSFVAVGVLVDGLMHRWRPRLTPWLILPALLVVGVLDQTSAAYTPPYSHNQSAFGADARFVHELEARLPRGAMVFQLPYLSFPEAAGLPAGEGGPRGLLLDYAPVRLYLHSSDLRWSYGAMRGRPSDWGLHLQTVPPSSLAAAVAASGFAGVTVDRLGYPRRSGDLIAGLARTLGSKPLYSPTRRFAFIDARVYRQRLNRLLTPDELLALRTAVLRPIQAHWGPGFWPPEHSQGKTLRWTKGREASIALDNPAPETRQVQLDVLLATGSTSPGPSVQVTFPDGTGASIVAGPAGARLQRTLSIFPGHNVIRFATDAPPTRTALGDPRPAIYLRVEDAVVTDASFPSLQGQAFVAPLLRVPLLLGAS
jgi:hypothetical protein